MVIELKNLTKKFGKFSALKKTNFKVNEGEIHGFLGPNGAGKSTTIRILLGFIEKTQGDAKLFGTDVHKGNIEHRKRIGYLPSDISFPINMTGEQVLKFALESRGIKASKRVDELKEILDVDLSKKMKNYSKGNKQKIGIIQALAHDPELLILDEPTTGLDPLMQNIFNKLLLEEKLKGKTIFMSSHILSDVENICDKVTMIQHGKILMTDNFNTLKKNKIKRVSIIYRDKEIPDFSKFKEVSNLISEENKLSFDVKGDLNHILSNLINLNIEDIEIKPLSLDEIFMNYYRSKEKEEHNNENINKTKLVK